MSDFGVHSEVGRLRFVWPLLAILSGITVVVLVVGAYLP
jgi:hypothetical protein